MTACAIRRAASATSLRVLVALGAALGCAGGADDEGASAPAAVQVGVAVVAAQPFTESLDVVGTAAPRPGHIAALSAPGPTRVTKIYVAIGQRVARGQAVIELDRAAFQAAAEGAQASLVTAERAHERARRLVDEGIVPRREVEQAAAELARARADAVAARRVEELAVLHAPISGVVTELGAVIGASVDPSQPLIEITDPAALDIVLSLSPDDAARVRRGARVDIAAGEHGAETASGSGTVTDIAAEVDSLSRTVAVRVAISALPRPLRVGETVSARIVLATRSAALTVPLESLVPEGEGFRVFVVDSANVAHARDVTVGARRDSTAEIVRGLTAGERIVTAGAYGVDDSVTVVPRSSGRRP